MGELAERLKTVGTKPISPCPVGKLLNTLDSETRTAFESAMNSRATTRAIHWELATAGIQIGRDTLAVHRDGLCRCKAVSE